MIQHTPTLRLTLLGGIHIALDEVMLDFAAERAAVLVAYLALSGRTHGREKLADFLWDDRTQKRALSNLRSLLAQLPDEIKPYLDITRKTLALQPDMPLWVDVLAFEALQAQEKFIDALALYTGDFLEGVYIRDSRGLDEWAATQRERLRQQAVALHLHLAERALHQRDYDAGMHHGRALLKHDPFNEAALRLTMRLFARAGQRTAALQAYGEMEKRLAAELGVEPSAETTQLYDRIVLAQLPVPFEVPRQLTPLIGRDDLLAGIEKRLDDPACRLLTLTGLGGAGKTRLSLAVAERRRHDYLNGIYFVPLARASTAQQLPLAVAQALGISLHSLRLPQEQIINYLREKELLLILDNLEHLVDEAAEFVQALLERVPLVQVLATSREKLNLRSEWVVPVTGLAYPAQWRHTAVLATYPAVALFVAAAQRVRPDFALGDEVDTAVVELCQLLDGVPLALELAGAAMLYTAPAQLVQQLQQTLDVLDSNLRDLPRRHRSLRAVFENSWVQLSPPEQTLLMKLAVFRRNLHLAAAEAVAGATPHLLRSLVAKSLLQHVGGDDYEWHEILRQYAWAHLQAQADLLATTAERHALYYLDLLQTQEDRLMSFELPDVLAVLGDEQENILQAWQWAVRHERFDLLAQTQRSLSFFYTAQAQYQMAEAAFREAATAVAQAIHPTQPQANLEILLAGLQTRQAYYLKELSLYEAALDLHHEALALATRHAQNELIAIGYLTAGQALWLQSHFAEAQKKLAQAVALARQHGPSWVVEDGLVTLGTIQLDMSELNQARTYYQEAIELAHQSGNVDAEMRGLLSWGNTQWFSGDYSAAQSTFDEVQALAEKVGNRVILGRVRGNIGLVASEQGDYEAGLRGMEEALLMSRQVGDQRGELTWLLNLAACRIESGDYERAQQGLQRAVQLAQELGDRQAVAMARDHLGVIALLAWGNTAVAQTHFTETIAICDEIGDDLGREMTRLNVAWWHYKQGEMAEALALTSEILPTAVETEHAPFTAETYLLHAHLLAQTEQFASAKAAYERAAALREENGQPHCAQEAYAGLAKLAQATGDTAQAVAMARRMAAHVLGGGQFWATKEPLAIYGVCARVLGLNGEDELAERVTAVGRATYELMLSRLENRHLRQAFAETHGAIASVNQKQ